MLCDALQLRSEDEMERRREGRAEVMTVSCSTGEALVNLMLSSTLVLSVRFINLAATKEKGCNSIQH